MARRGVRRRVGRPAVAQERRRQAGLCRVPLRRQWVADRRRVSPTGAVWRALRPGSMLQVRYLPENPRRWVLAGARRTGCRSAWRTSPPWRSPHLPSCVAASVRRQRTLLSDGTGNAGIVTAVKVHRGTHGSRHTEMAYDFRLEGGMTTGKARRASPRQLGRRSASSTIRTSRNGVGRIRSRS